MKKIWRVILLIFIFFLVINLNSCKEVVNISNFSFEEFTEKDESTGEMIEVYHLTSIDVNVTNEDDITVLAFPSIYNNQLITAIDAISLSSFMNLERIIIPKSIKSLDVELFLECQSLKTLYYEGDRESLTKMIDVDSLDIEVIYDYNGNLEKLSSICLLLSVVIMATGIIWAFISHRQRLLLEGDISAKRRYAFTPILKFGVCFFIGAIFIFIPIYYYNYFWDTTSNSVRICQSIFLSIHNTMRLFILDGDFDIIKTNIVFAKEWLDLTYNLYAALIFVIAPLFSAGIVISIFKNVAESSKFFLRKISIFKRNFYVMSCLTERSVTLAEDIYKRAQEKHERALVVFADVFDRDEEKIFELITRVKRIGGVCLRKDVTEVFRANMFSRSKKINKPMKQCILDRLEKKGALCEDIVEKITISKWQYNKYNIVIYTTIKELPSNIMNQMKIELKRKFDVTANIELRDITNKYRRELIEKFIKNYLSNLKCNDTDKIFSYNILENVVYNKKTKEVLIYSMIKEKMQDLIINKTVLAFKDKFGFAINVVIKPLIKPYDKDNIAKFTFNYLSNLKIDNTDTKFFEKYILDDIKVRLHKNDVTIFVYTNIATREVVNKDAVIEEMCRKFVDKITKDLNLEDKKITVVIEDIHKNESVKEITERVNNLLINYLHTKNSNNVRYDDVTIENAKIVIANRKIIITLNTSIKPKFIVGLFTQPFKELKQLIERELQNVFNKKIVVKVKKVHCKKIYLMGEHEEENIKQALVMINYFKQYKKYDVPTMKFYVFAISEESKVLLSTIDSSEMIVRRVRQNHNLVLHMLEKYPIFETSYYKEFQEDDKTQKQEEKPGIKKIVVAIIGLGRYGIELLKALCWLGQMKGYHLEINVFDNDPECSGEEKLRRIAPGLLNLRKNISDMPKGTKSTYEISPKNGDASYTIKFYNNCDVRSPEFLNTIMNIKDLSKVYTALGDDEFNIETAMHIRIHYLRKTLAKPKEKFLKLQVMAIVYNAIKNETHELNMLESENSSCQVILVGSLKIRYSINFIEQEVLERLGLVCHTKWANTRGGEKEIAYQLKRYEQREYYRDASMAEALYNKIRYKVGLDPKELDKITDNQLDELARYEHIRWNAYMRSEGYIHQTKTSFYGKTHKELVPYEELSNKSRNNLIKMLTLYPVKDCVKDENNNRNQK